MKLFNAIAAAAVIGTSLIAATPAEARNGWIYVGKGSRTGTTHYVRKTGYQGALVKFEWQTANTDKPYTDPFVADCNAWAFKDVSYANASWEEGLPGSISGSALEAICR